MLLITKSENNLILEKLGWLHLNQVIKISITNDRTNCHYVPCCDALRMIDTTHICFSYPKCKNLNLTMGERQTNPN